MGILSRAARIDSGTFAGRATRFPLRLVPKNLVVPIVSGPMKGLRWRVGASVHGCWLGTYELDEQRLLQRMVAPGMVAWDLGANAGVYTLLFARLVGPGGSVYAFEPLPDNCAELLRHVALNGFSNVTVVSAAIAQRDGLLGFQRTASQSMGTLQKEFDGLVVATVSVDGLLRDRKLPSPDVVKMDVEGAEAEVLTGAKSLLANGRTRWIVSLHGSAQADACERIFRDTGYTLSDLSGRQIPGSISASGITDIVASP